MAINPLSSTSIIVEIAINIAVDMINEILLFQNYKEASNLVFKLKRRRTYIIREIRKIILEIDLKN